MCCRYYFDEKTIADIEKIVKDVDRRLYHAQDICPGDHAPIILSNHNQLEVRSMKWGFVNPVSQALVINATSEHASEKPLFKHHLMSRRCAIPAKHFYEWDRNLQKYTFSLTDDSAVMYMAGIYNLYNNEDHFVIFTTQANASMAPVHDRMPLILSEKDMINLWLKDGTEGLSCLKKMSPGLNRETEYEQLSLF